MDRSADKILVVALLGCLGVLLLAVVAAVAFAGGVVVASVQRQGAVALLPPAATMMPAPPVAQPTPGVMPGNPRTATGTAPRGNPGNPAAAPTVRTTATSRATAGATPASRPVIRAIDLPANDLVYHPASQRIWASVPATGGQWGNSVVPIDPATGVVGTAIFVGSEPTRLALTDDGRYL